MSTVEFAINDLKRILVEAAGEPDAGVDLSGDITGTEFDQLGYDSIAVMETGSRIEREYGIRLDEARLVEARTPGELVELVNEHLGARVGA